MGKRFWGWSFAALLFLSCGCSSAVKNTTYTVAIDPSWYPLEVPGLENAIVAFSIELLVEIAKLEDLNLAITRMNWDNLLWGLRGGQYNAILSTLRPYSFYDKTYAFSNPYLLTGPVLIVPKESKKTSLSQFAGKEIGVVTGSSGALVLETTANVLFQRYDSIADVLAALADQQIDGACVEMLVGQEFVRNLYSDVLKVIPEALTEEGLRLVTLYKMDAALLKRFDKGLKLVKKNGTYEKLLQKWGLTPDATSVANLDQLAEQFLHEVTF